MSPTHIRCGSTAPYTIEVGGVLGADGPRPGRRLLAVDPDGSWRIGPPASDADPSVRLTDLVAAPALYDAHVHLHPDVPLADYVTYGVGRVRDLGSREIDGHVHRVAGATCANPVPDIVRGGPMLDRPGPPRLLIAAGWDEPAQLPALLDAAVTRGSRWVKLYEGFPVELFAPTVRQAHDRGLRVAVHPGPGDYRAALAADVDELEHLACLVPPGPRGTHALLARWAGRRPGDDWPRVPEGTAVCPTLLAQHSLVTEARRGWAFDGHDPRMVSFWRASAIARRRWSDDELTRGERAVVAVAHAFGELDRAGVRWVVGSDTPNPGLRPGLSMWQEMNLLMEAGMDRLRVYHAASVAPGVTATGTHPITFLPASVFRAGPFPVTPPAATLLRGCLYRPEESHCGDHLPT